MDQISQNVNGPKRGAATGVLCADCEHLNAPGSTECGYCGAALFLKCPKCGQQTQTALPRCTHCQTSLRHRRRHSRLWRRVFSGGQKLTFSQILLIALVLAFIYLFLTRLV